MKSSGFFLILNLWIFSQVVFGFSVHAQEKTKADTNREVALTYAQAYLDQKLYDEAELVIQATLKNDGADGAILNFLGLIQMQERNFAQACHSFRTAVLEFKESIGRSYAMYNLADCLYQGGREADAIKVLRDLAEKEPGISSTAENTISLIESGFLTPGSALPPFEKKSRGKFGLTGVLTTGFDTNVLLVEEVVSEGIALKDRGSFYYSPAVQFGYRGKVFGTLLDGRWISAYTNYVNPSTRVFNNLYNRMDLFFGRGNVRWNLFGDAVFLNDGSFDVYNFDVGLMWQNIQKKGTNDYWTYEIPLRFQKFYLASGTASDNDRTGVDLQARIGYRTQWAETDFFSATATLDNQYSLGKNYRLTGFSVPATIGYGLPWLAENGFVNTLNAEIGGQFFWQSTSGRQDIWYKLGTGMITPFFRDWTLSFEYYFFKNNSTVDAATYRKEVISMLIGHEFL